MRPLVSPFDEAKFQNWFNGLPNVQANITDPEVRHRMGLLTPDPDEPQHFYDYRGAYMGGAQISPNMHLPSQYKIPGNSRQFIMGMDTQSEDPMQQNLWDLLTSGGNMGGLYR